eukprot:GHVN01020874.1.p1 GENE.GHVN01020874.1~~GHVN01020874.1.p1  ORF type:complete len:370 (+),score=54.58 GHVN01020874.1:858-1967(+)
MLTVINRRITSKAIEMIRNIQSQAGERWRKFWDSFGKYIKVGVVEDRDNQEQIASLVEYPTSHDAGAKGGDRTSLDDYVSRMKANQTAIYYISGETKQAAAESPSLEALRVFGFEVLYAIEAIDEFSLQALGAGKYKGFDVIDANKADLKLPEAHDTENKRQLKQELEELCDWLHNFYGTRKLQRVQVSGRLKDSPAILVQGDFGMSPTMQKYMKQQAAAQGMAEGELYGGSMNQAVLEINPTHPITKRLKDAVYLDKGSTNAKNLAQMVFDVASLQGGYPIEDPARFARKISELMSKEASAQLRSDLHYKEQTMEESRDVSDDSAPAPDVTDEEVRNELLSDKEYMVKMQNDMTPPKTSRDPRDDHLS